MNESLTVAIGPHIKSAKTTKRIMWVVTLSLLPAGAAGVFIFGMSALRVILVSVLAAVASETFILKLRKKDIGAVWDGSAILTGLLLAYNLPPKAPLWLPAAGSIFAVIIGKQVFGGLGHNIFNPALAGRAFLMVSWPVYMTTWSRPRWAVDAISGATPLGIVKNKEFAGMANASWWNLFIGNRPGCIGEVCSAALLAGGLYLLVAGHITWHIPFSYIMTVALASWAFNGSAGIFTGDALFFVLAGGLMLGAFFMATDYVTSPLSARGKTIFGIGCGILTFIIRKFAGYPEGVSYAILIMNALVPLIDKYTYPKWFGWRRP